MFDTPSPLDNVGLKGPGKCQYYKLCNIIIAHSPNKKRKACLIPVLLLPTCPFSSPLSPLSPDAAGLLDLLLARVERCWLLSLLGRLLGIVPVDLDLGMAAAGSSASSPRVRAFVVDGCLLR